MKRRRFLKAVLAGSTTGLAGCGRPPGRDGQSNTTDASETATTKGSLPNAVGLQTLASGMQTPLDVAFAPDADRRYVAEQTGLIHLHGSNGLRKKPFLDLRDTVEAGGEKGLLGIALHPNFAENRRLFVRYSAPLRSGAPANYSHTFVLSEFVATEDGGQAKRDSERVVLEIPEPQSNHNAGDITFGADGYLYVAVGDGGGGGDQGTGHVSDWYGAVDGGNGQDVTENLLGSILRIDVETRANGKGYGIPDDNPLVGTDGLDEHYAWGFRNPWRFSFDRGEFFVSDVGQSSYEEVNLVQRGGNYGWNVKEGTHCYEADNCPDGTPGSVRGGEPLVSPIIEYPHSGGSVSGISVIGGYVYRGSALRAMEEAYIFGDLQAGGRLFAATRPDGDGQWPTRVVTVAGDSGRKIEQLFSFGRDDAGELYVLGSGADGDGGLHRIVPAG
ncbi:sugar dehydrogenase [Haladaptatus sp. W1]|uniref:PQQ-dependent sugar dehydrogenase n=1 Tax=Haladaptatus sp. W1 TaxID=1897478 RepID=UPI000849E681|nr:PQQ-dependent sugar dehydrogenase [Haladaptatus sp. W1]ODR79516.1 sugar dehydrogenase [Haladaptatus sp. W1]